MAYSDYNDVQSLVKWCIFSASSKVTITEVTEFITEADNFINSKLERIYVVPITDIEDIEILKYISCRLAAIEVAQVLVLQASGEVPQVVKEWAKSTYERLQLVIDLELELVNSTKIAESTHSKLYSFTAHGDADNEAPDPVWETGVNQW